MEWKPLNCYTYSGLSPLSTNGISVRLNLTFCNHKQWSHMCRFCLTGQSLSYLTTWYNTTFNRAVDKKKIKHICCHCKDKWHCIYCNSACDHNSKKYKCLYCYSSIFDLYIEMNNKYIPEECLYNEDVQMEEVYVVSEYKEIEQWYV